MAFEVSLRGHVILRCEKRRILGPEHLFDLGQRPDVEFALLAFRIRIERGRKRPLRCRHLARKPFDRLGRALAEQRVAGARMRERQQLQELRVVVEHLLEVRHQPALVDRIARKAAAQMIVDPALADVLEGQQHAAEERRRGGPRLVLLRRRALAGAPEQFEQAALGKLRRAAQSPVLRVDRARDAARHAIELGEPDHDLALGPRLLGKPRHQGIAVLADAVRLLAEQPRELAQHIGECRAAVARLLREVRAAPHRLARGRQEHRERPAALLAEQMQRVHVDLVDVGPLLAVDLDADEQLVHHARRRLVLEALVRHHMAPVAGRVSDREQDRLVRAASPRRAPPVPTRASRPDCAGAAADTAMSPRRGDWCGRWLTRPSWPLCCSGNQCLHANKRFN